MAARRRGGHGQGNLHRDDPADNPRVEIQALRRQVQDLTLRLERYEGHSERNSNHEYSSDDSKPSNLFAGNREPGDSRGGNRLTDSIRLDLPEFHGQMQAEEFLDWLSATEKFLDFKEVPESHRVKLVTTRLRGYVAVWWDRVQEIRMHKGKPKIGTWEKMKARLRENFLSVNFAQTLFLHFNDLQQGYRGVTEYTEEFYKLCRRIP